MTNNLISVIIPCYNSANHIPHAIDSLLCQTYKNLEIIIVDDNSTDNLREVVQSYLEKYNFIRYVKLPYRDLHRFNKEGNNINAGWMARNHGVSLSNGELITFQDADDGCFSNRIEVQLYFMRKYNSHHVVVDWQQYKDDYNCKKLDFDINRSGIIGSDEILILANSNKRGFLKYPFGKNEDHNIFKKIVRKINRKIVGECISYPGAGGTPLVKKEVFEKCKFRPLWERTRPSLRGRGADQDFNYWVTEVYRDSIVVKVPLYLWRAKNQNTRYKESYFDKFKVE